MIKPNFIEQLLDGVEVEWKTVGEVFDILAGGDVPKHALSDKKTKEFNIPILSNGTEDKALYGWTNIAKIAIPSLTISARGTIGWTSFRDKPFFPIIRLLVLTPKINLNLKYAYYYMKMIENNYKVSETGIPQLTKPMIKDVKFPIPFSENLEKSLQIQAEIVRVLDTFTELTAELTTELTVELTARKKQYTYYRDKLLTFQHSEVEWKTLGEIGEFVRGNGLQKSDFVESGVGCIHYGQIYTYYGNFAYQTKSFVSPTLATKLKKAQKGDLIIATTSENIEDVCKPLVWLGEDEVCISGETYVFKHNQNPKYIAYYLQTPMFFDYKKQNRTGTKVIRVHGDKLKKFKIPLPSLAEQERIVSILDKFDALTSSITESLLREIELRKKQYKSYRNMLLSFPKSEVEV